MVVRDPKNREAMFSAYVHLALACDRLRDVGGRDRAMLSAIRYFPQRVIHRNQFGPEAERIFRLNRAVSDRAGRGRVTITISDKDAVIYFDEVATSQGRLALGDVVPGRHRVLVTSSTGDSRQYQVDVIADEETRLYIDWAVESALVTGDWVGFQHPTDGHRGYEPTLVRNLARARTNAAFVTTYHVAPRPANRYVLTASVYEVTRGRLLRTLRVELDRPVDALPINRLAEAVARDVYQTGVEIVSAPGYEDRSAADLANPKQPAPTDPVAAAPRALVAPNRQRSGTRRGWTPLLTGIAGVTAAVSGVYLWTADGRCWPGYGQVDTSCEHISTTKEFGWAALGAGVALTGVSAYLYWRSFRTAPRTARIGGAPTAGGAIAFASWVY